MKLIILILILSMFFIPIGLCEIIKDDINLNNIKIYDKNDKIISIYNKNIDKSMDIKLISTISDIDKLIKIIEITNYIEYIPNKENDFITKTKKVYGKNDVYKIEYFIEKYNYTFENIIINETIYNNKTCKNETKLINKSIIKDIKPYWIEFKPYNRTILKNETFKLKIIHYKKPELGFFKIQTIPIFKNIECKEFTWWDGNWNLKRAILINNTNGDNVINYQLKSVNLSIYQINASSARIINETSGLIQNHWNESIDFNGNLEFVWCNFSEINNSLINSIYYIYYQSIPNVNTISNGNLTFLQYHGYDSISFIDSLIISPIEFIYQGKVKTTSELHNINYGLGTNLVDEPIHGTFFKSYTYASLSNIYSISRNLTGSTFYTTSPALLNENNYTLKIIKNASSIIYYIDDMQRGDIIIENLPDSNLGLYFFIAADTGIQYFSFVRKYTFNESELWTVGNIEYPEGLNMTCNLKIITHLTDKKVQIVDMNASIVNESYTNECINLTYDSYIVYMSNPVKIDSMTALLNILDNILVQFLLFIFLIIIATLFYVFIQIVKKKGFKGVIK